MLESHQIFIYFMDLHFKAKYFKYNNYEQTFCAACSSSIAFCSIKVFSIKCFLSGKMADDFDLLTNIAEWCGVDLALLLEAPE